MENRILNKIFTGVLTGIIISIIGTWYNNDIQTKRNATRLDNIEKKMGDVDLYHSIRLEKLEKSRDSMSEIYVTRREFNKVIEMQNEKMDMINKNIEKLLDLQLNKR